MTQQLDMFGAAGTLRARETATARRDRVIDAVQTRHDAWISSVVDAIRAFDVGADLTSDDLWLLVDDGSLDAPAEPRAFGAAFVAAKRLGLIVNTYSGRATRRPERNGGRVTVWRRL